MHNEIDYKKLAQEVTNNQSKEMLSFNDVCAILGYAKGSTPARRIVARPDFPPSTEMLSTSRRKWFKRDVLEWIERQRVQRSNTLRKVTLGA